MERRGIGIITQKQKKPVWIPISPELMFALEDEKKKSDPSPSERVLSNPSGRRPLTRIIVYNRMRWLGRRSGVEGVHPHRFRDTLAVDLLLRGASPYDVAKLLGNTVAIVEKYYAPFVHELRERTRQFMEGPGGLEDKGTNWARKPIVKN